VAKVNFKSKWILAIVALFGVSLIATGVFASASISINNGNAINLGAGRAVVEACDDQVTISTAQTYSDADQRYELSEIEISGLDAGLCNGRTIKMTLDYELCASNGSSCSPQTPVNTTWTGYGTSGDVTLTWGEEAGDGTDGTESTSALPAINTALVGEAYIAISAE
jgi:hypothetical protein